MDPHTDPTDFKNPQAPLAGLNILVVEDDVDNQELYKAILSKAGAKVTIANDGLEGCTLAMDNNYDSILMDIRMPAMDGNEAVKMLRLQGFQLPIFAFTAHTTKEIRAKALADGFNDFLSKPVDAQKLIEMILKHRKA